MKRTNLNFLIDGLAFAAFLALLSTGLLLRYQLPPRSGGVHGFGAGHAADERMIALLWGWTRHEWGQIHYWIAGVLIAILAVHLVLHWKWIVCVVRGNRSEASGLRFGLGLASLLALIGMSVAPLVAPTEQILRGDLEQRRSESEHADSVDRDQEVRGSMTLAEAARAADLTVNQLISELHLPQEVSASQSIGPLLRQNGMRMSDLRRLLEPRDADSLPEESTR